MFQKWRTKKARKLLSHLRRSAAFIQGLFAVNLGHQNSQTTSNEKFSDPSVHKHRRVVFPFRFESIHDIVFHAFFHIHLWCIAEIMDRLQAGFPSRWISIFLGTPKELNQSSDLTSSSQMNSSAISQTLLFQERVALVKAKELYKRVSADFRFLLPFSSLMWLFVTLYKKLWNSWKFQEGHWKTYLESRECILKSVFFLGDPLLDYFAYQELLLLFTPTLFLLTLHSILTRQEKPYIVMGEVPKFHYRM